MTFQIRISCDSAAFEANEGAEVARILREAADNLESMSGDALRHIALRDNNGNSVGLAQWIDRAE